MVKNKNQKRKAALAMKNSIEALRFQTLWGLKKLGLIDEFQYRTLAFYRSYVSVL